jgi:hypothetical protein
MSCMNFILLVELVLIVVSIYLLSADVFPAGKNWNALPASAKITCYFTEYMQSRYVYENFANTL